MFASFLRHLNNFHVQPIPFRYLRYRKLFSNPTLGINYLTTQNHLFTCESCVQFKIRAINLPGRRSASFYPTAELSWPRRLYNKVYFYIFTKNRLKATGFVVFQNIVDNINYKAIFVKLNLPDTFYSWFVITELYVWMTMVRYMAEGDTGKEVRDSVVEALWIDFKPRANELMSGNSSKVRSQLYEMSTQFNAAIIAYDEGLQSNDVVLAGALWRRMYQQGEVNPAHLDILVKYIREQVVNLDKLSREDLFEKRDLRWKSFVP